VDIKPYSAKKEGSLEIKAITVISIGGMRE